MFMKRLEKCTCNVSQPVLYQTRVVVFFVLADMQTLKAQFVADPMTNYLLIVWRPLSAAGEQMNITEQFRFSMSE